MRLPSCAVLSRRLLLSLAPALVPLRPLPAVARSAFIDPAARFAIEIPDGFVVSPRKTSTGTIFVAGNFPRFAVISVTAWPVEALLAEDARTKTLPGLPPPPPVSAGPTLASLGSAEQVAQILLRKRDRESSSGALESVLLSASLDGSSGAERLSWACTTETPVSDPDELEKQTGRRQRIRRTAVASVLGSLPGEGASAVPAVISAWGSSLAEDWEADLSAPLERAVRSFTLNAS